MDCTEQGFHCAARSHAPICPPLGVSLSAKLAAASPLSVRLPSTLNFGRLPPAPVPSEDWPFSIRRAGTKVYFTVSFTCTINAWNMTVDAGTAHDRRLENRNRNGHPDHFKLNHRERHSRDLNRNGASFDHAHRMDDERFRERHLCLRRHRRFERNKSESGAAMSIIRRIVLLLLLALPTYAVPTFVRGNTAIGTGVVTFSSNTAGDLLVVGVQFPGVTTISDSAGNTWQTAFVLWPTGSAAGLRIYYAENCKASAGTNTVTVTSTTRIAIAEYSGMAASLSYGSAAQSNTTLSTPSFNVTTGDLIVGLGWSSGFNIGAGSGMTLREKTSDNVMLLGEGIASGSTFTTNMTGTGSVDICSVAFHADPAPSQAPYKGGDYTFAQEQSAGAHTETANFASNTAGNLLVAYVFQDQASLSVTLSDTAGNTWILKKHNYLWWRDGRSVCCRKLPRVFWAKYGIRRIHNIGGYQCLALGGRVFH